MTKEELLQIAKHCEKLANREIKPEKNWSGLCSEIYDKFGVYILNYIRCSEWSDYSSDPIYPIKPPHHETLNPKEHYKEMNSRLKNIWDVRTKYGKARLKFTAWVAKELFELAEKNNGQ